MTLYAQAKSSVFPELDPPVQRSRSRTGVHGVPGSARSDACGTSLVHTLLPHDDHVGTHVTGDLGVAAICILHLTLNHSYTHFTTL